MRRFRSQEIRAGQRFRRSGLNRFQRPFPTWEVEEVSRDVNGSMSASLRSVTDQTARKTIAVVALSDPNMYKACH